MKFNIKRSFKNYLSKRKWYSVLSDVIFIALVILLLIPSTRTQVTSLFIKLTSFSPSQLDKEDQFVISEQARTWTIENIDGEPFLFGQLNKNKPVFINFWATWCPPCVAEMPGILKLYEDYGDKVNFVIVSNESRAKVRAFAKDKGYEELPFYKNSNVPYDFYSTSIPTTYIIDKKGRVIINEKGIADWNSGKIRKLMDEITR